MGFVMRGAVLLALVAAASAVLRRDGKDEVLFQPSTPRGPFTEQPPAVMKDCHDKLEDGFFCELKSGACEKKCKSGAWQHVITKDVRAGQGQCCTKQDSPYKCRDQFEARPYKYEAPPKKLPGANCTKWEMSHVRTVIAKLKMKTNETKPSEWNIMT